MKILFRDCHGIVKQLQTVVPCEIQEITKYIFEKSLFLQKKLLIYMCMCMCMYVYMSTCVCICVFVGEYFLYIYNLFIQYINETMMTDCTIATA